MHLKNFLVISCLVLWTASLVSCVNLRNAFPNITITHPVGFEIDGISDKFYVVSQPGVVYILDKNNSQINQTTLEEENVFLNITERVVSGFGEDERGLLGIAFPPNFTQNRTVYVHYTGQPSNVFSSLTSYISRFDVSADGKADPDSEFFILKQDQPFPNHNGGQIKFGPSDGMLYIALGDGGNAGDPFDIGQNLGTILGKILRVDVTKVDNNSFFNNTATLVSSTTFRRYGIPADNPFATGDTLFVQPEIWAYGLRNPWRFSFDRSTGKMWNGDAGQDRYEEINIIEKGGNYGWRIKEGNACFFPPAACNQFASAQRKVLIDPIHTYTHRDFNPRTLETVVIGGFVYRGSRIPDLFGKYVFGDEDRGFIHALNFEPGNEANNTVEVIVRGGIKVASFGEDQNGELYALDFQEGRILEFLP